MLGFRPPAPPPPFFPPLGLSSLQAASTLQAASSLGSPLGLPFPRQAFPPSPPGRPFQPSPPNRLGGEVRMTQEERTGGEEGDPRHSSPPPPSSSPHCSPSNPPPQETVYETAARLLFMAVRWTKNLASFAALPFRDQVLLLEESWTELFLLCSIQWCLPHTSPALFSPTDLPDLPPSLQGVLVQLEGALHRFRQLNIDPAEFACLKAIVLFKPDVCGLKDTSEVENLQDQSLAMLQHHVSSVSGGGSLHHRLPTRFPRLLLALSALQSPPAGSVEKIYFEKTIGATPMEKLLGDMFKS